MKKIIKALKTTSLFMLITLAFIACDKDFSSIESDIQGSENFSTNSKKFPIVAYNKKVNPVQTNQLPSNLLGVYKSSTYGLTTTNVVTQIVPTSFDPDFGDNPELESVILTVPYYVTNLGTDDNGEVEYELDSLFGSEPIKLSIYKSNYFLRDFNPENAEETQKYYSNINATVDFDNPPHRGELLFESDDFYPSNLEIVLTEINEETGEEEESERIAPSLRVELLNPGGSFWEDLLFFDDVEDISHQELSNSNNFKEYFRGLYFKTEAVDANGNMIMLNFSTASVIVNYTHVTGTEIDDDTGEEVDVREDGFYGFNFSGNRLNIIENDPTNTVIDNANTMANDVDGDEHLFLKGGEGAMAVIDLFNGDVLDEETDTYMPAFEYFNNKKEKWLINEANIVFYVDQTLVNDNEPDRILLLDLNTNLPVIDYFIDGSTNSADPVNSKINHSSLLERDEEKNGIKYKIKITEHINNIFIRDSLNTKLGLFVSTNVNEIQQSSILDSEDELVTNISSGTVLSPKGTILHGSHENVDDEKRVQLEIFYTEPEN
ncbi:DUF4270 domain-containing protein [Lacinutrix iliipiscaria]|uniref:DUF4270 domain-containing protein n=1 Tax=Lacinutrix iliipiscaria TaxID=1230532 RepID=A0ABW5WK83_9FLAO